MFPTLHIPYSSQGGWGSHSNANFTAGHNCVGFVEAAVLRHGAVIVMGGGPVYL